MPYPNEHACRLHDPGKYAEIRRENNFQGAGYDVLWGIISKGKSEMQAIRYPTERWTAARARAHCSEKGGSFEAASGQASAFGVGTYENEEDCIRGLMVQATSKYPNGYPREVAQSLCHAMALDQAAALRFSFDMPLREFARKQGKLIVPIDVIEEGFNLNDWGVSDSARSRSVQSLKSCMMLGPPDKNHPGIIPGGPTEDAPHFGDWYPVKGHFFDVQSNGKTYGIAEIDDPYAEANIESGEWKAVSPSVYGIARRDQDGKILFDDFVFQHILFLPKDKAPAYPGAGVKGAIPVAAAQGSFKIALQAAVDQAFSKRGCRLDDMAAELMQAFGAVCTAQAVNAWDTADAPDSLFAIVPESAKGPNGNKSDRKLPLAAVETHKIHPNIIRVALARFSQLKGVGADLKAFALRKICKIANGLGIDSPVCQNLAAMFKGTSSDEDDLLDVGEPSLPPKTGTQGDTPAHVESPEPKTSTQHTQGDGTMSQDPDAEKGLLQKIKDLLGQGASTTVPVKDEVTQQQGKEIEELTARAAALETALKGFETMQQAAQIDEIIQSELRHGMIDEKGREAEVTRLKALTKDALAETKATIGRAAAVISAMPVKGPEPFEATKQGAEFKELVRQGLYNYQRNEKFEKVA